MVITCCRETDILFSVQHKSTSSFYGCLSFIANDLQFEVFYGLHPLDKPLNNVGFCHNYK